MIMRSIALLLFIVYTAYADSVLGPLDTTAVDKAREDRVHSEIDHVHELLPVKSKEKLGAVIVATRAPTASPHVAHRSTASPLAKIKTFELGFDTLTEPPVAVLDTKSMHLDDLEKPHHNTKKAYDLYMETSKRVLKFGGPEVVISSVEAIMFNMLDDRLPLHFHTKLGSIVESVSLTLDFLEESVTKNDKGETIGEADIKATIHFHTYDASSLIGLDETNVTQILESYFVGDLHLGFIRDLKEAGVVFSFLYISPNSMEDENNDAPTSKPVSMTVAAVGFLGLAVGAWMLSRRLRCGKDAAQDREIETNESEEDQFFHSLEPVYAPTQPIVSFRSTTNLFGELKADDDDDSLGSERFLDWPIEKEVSSRWKKSSLYDVSVDSDDGSHEEILQ